MLFGDAKPRIAGASTSENFAQWFNVRQGAEFAGLVSREIGSGRVLSPKHHSLLSSYRLNLGHGPKVVHDMLVASRHFEAYSAKKTGL
jgi:hypothetical protein